MPLFGKVARQFNKIGQNLGPTPNDIDPEDVAKNYEKLGDVFEELINTHYREFRYPTLKE